MYDEPESPHEGFDAEEALQVEIPQQLETTERPKSALPQ